MDTKIISFLTQNFYGCVKFNSNKEKLTDIIPNVAGETGVIIIRNTKEDLNITQEYLRCYNISKKVDLITARDFIEKKDKIFSHYSLIFIDDFQKGDLYTLVIIQEWYKKFLGMADTKMPYLLLGSLVESYQKIPLPLDHKKILDLTKSSQKKIKVTYSEENFIVDDDTIYEKISENIISSHGKDKRILVILPNHQRIEQVSHLLEKDDRFIISKKIFFKTTRHTKPVVMLSTDFSRTGIYIEELDHVYDSGEIMRKYTTRTGSDKYCIKKIDREEIEIRRDSYLPDKYSLMIPKSSVINLSRSTIPIPYRINLPPHILYIYHHGITDIPVSKNLESINETLKLINLVGPDMKITKKGEFCMNLDLDVYNSSFLYYSLKNSLPLFPVIVIVSIFHHTTYMDSDLMSFCEIFRDVTKNISDGTFETHKEIHSTIEILEKEFNIKKSEKIFNPEKKWNEILEHIPKIYLGRVCHYSGGRYSDGFGKIWKFSEGKRNFSKILLPTSRYTNEKGENFIDFGVPLEKMVS